MSEEESEDADVPAQGVSSSEAESLEVEEDKDSDDEGTEDKGMSRTRTMLSPLERRRSQVTLAVSSLMVLVFVGRQVAAQNYCRVGRSQEDCQ